MYGIIYFEADHTVMTIRESHRDLSVTSFEVGSHCVMMRGSKTKTPYDGIIIKTGEKEVDLKKSGNKLVSILKECERGEAAVSALQNAIKEMANKEKVATKGDKKRTLKGVQDLKPTTCSSTSTTTESATSTTVTESHTAPTSLLETWRKINTEFSDPVVVASQSNDTNLQGTEMSVSVVQPPSSILPSQCIESNFQAVTQTSARMQSTPGMQLSHATGVVQQPTCMQSPPDMQLPHIPSVVQPPAGMQSPPPMQLPNALCVQSPLGIQSNTCMQSPPGMQLSHNPNIIQSPVGIQSPTCMQSSPGMQMSHGLSIVQTPGMQLPHAQAVVQSTLGVQSPSVMQSLCDVRSPSPSFTQLLSSSAIQTQATPFYTQMHTNTEDQSSFFQPPTSCQPESPKVYIDLDASDSQGELLPFSQPHSSSNVTFDSPSTGNIYGHPTISPGLKKLLTYMIDPKIQLEIKALLGKAENQEQPQKSSVKRNKKTRLFPVTPQHESCSSVTAAANTDMTEAEDVSYQLRCSPRKKSCTVQSPDDHCEKMTQLLDNNPTVVSSSKLRKAKGAALKNFNSGFCLMGKLIPEVISRVDLARSKGQGIGTVAKDDLRSTLDIVKVAACKGYVRAWCKEHNKAEPDDTQLNKAITQQIDYSRKLLKKILSVKMQTP